MPKLRRITDFPSPGTRIIDLTVEQLAAVLDAATERQIERIKRAALEADELPLKNAAKAVRKRSDELRAAQRAGVVPSRMNGARIMLRMTDVRAWVANGCPVTGPTIRGRA
jgi:hypothetical protein